MCRQCYSKQYYNDHKKEIKQYRAKYRTANKEEIKQTEIKYRIAHKEEIKQRKAKHRYANGGQPASENKQCPVFLGVNVAEGVLSQVFKDVEVMPYGYKGYDFICNRGKKIDVKSSCTHVRNNRSDSWGFNIKKNKTADFFLCMAFDNREDLTPLYLWLIPAKVVNHSTKASIAKSTIAKWDEYRLDIDKVAACCDRNGDV